MSLLDRRYTCDLSYAIPLQYPILPLYAESSSKWGLLQHPISLYLKRLTSFCRSSLALSNAANIACHLVDPSGSIIRITSIIFLTDDSAMKVHRY